MIRHVAIASVLLSLAACSDETSSPDAALPDAGRLADAELQGPEPCTGATLSGAAASVARGTSVLLLASAGCPDDRPVGYRFTVRLRDAASEVLRELDASPSATWDTAGRPLGEYTVEVDVEAGDRRSSASTLVALYEVLPSEPAPPTETPAAPFGAGPGERSNPVVVEAGAGQTAYLNQGLAPVVLTAYDARGRPLVGAAVRVRTQAGARAEIVGAATDARGRITLSLTLGLRPGAYRFEVEIAGAPPTTIEATAIEPPRGTIFSLTRPAHGTTNYGGWPGPGTGARLEHPVGVAVDGDGTIYFSDQGTCHVFALSTDGELRVLAGNGAQYMYGSRWTCANGGNNGPAVDASLEHPMGLAIDVPGRRLLVSQVPGDGIPRYSYVRMISLRTGVIFLEAGTAVSNDTQSNPIPLSRLVLRHTLDPVLGPDGALYIENSQHYRRIGPRATIAEWWPPENGPGQPRPPPGRQNYLGSGFERAYRGYSGHFGGIRFDSTGVAYIAHEIEPDVEGLGIVARSESDTILMVGGGTSTVANGQLGTELNLGWDASTTMAFDPADNLYFADHEGHVIRRLDRATSRVTTVAGNGRPGFNGDYIPAVDAQVDSPALMVWLPGGHLLFADSANNTVRIIW